MPRLRWVSMLRWRCKQVRVECRMLLRLSLTLALVTLSGCRPTLDAASSRALARLGVPSIVTRAGLDSAVGPGPDVTQCSDGREVRRYDVGDTEVVVTLHGRWLTGAEIVAPTLRP